MNITPYGNFTIKLTELNVWNIKRGGFFVKLNGSCKSCKL